MLRFLWLLKLWPSTGGAHAHEGARSFRLDSSSPWILSLERPSSDAHSASRQLPSECGITPRPLKLYLPIWKLTRRPTPTPSALRRSADQHIASVAVGPSFPLWQHALDAISSCISQSDIVQQNTCGYSKTRSLFTEEMTGIVG